MKTTTLKDGNEYRFTTLDLGDWREFGAWLNRSMDLPPNKPRGLNELIEAADTLTGGLWLLTRSLQNANPDTAGKLNEREVQELIGTPIEFARLQLEVLVYILGLPEPDGSSPDPTEAEVQMS